MAQKTINEAEAQRLRSWILEMKEQGKEREERLKIIRSRRAALQEAVDEYNLLGEQEKELKSDQRDAHKLLDSLISFAEKASGEDFVYNGPIFEN